MADLKRMLEEIRMEVDYTSRMIGRTAFDERVMDAMATVPRHAFVPPEMQSRAYINGPLPIGDGQTISQPYIVALMTDLLDPEPDHVILEVGTGSGYQAAVLSQLVSKVYSIEIIEKLSHRAAATLSALGYDNVVCVGWLMAITAGMSSRPLTASSGPLRPHRFLRPWWISSSPEGSW